MNGTLFTERGTETVIRRKENELIAKGYRNAASAHPFRLRVWEYTVQHRSTKHGGRSKRLIAWMTPDKS